MNKAKTKPPAFKHDDGSLMAMGPYCKTVVAIDGNPIGMFAFPVDPQAIDRLKEVFCEYKDFCIENADPKPSRPLDDIDFVMTWLSARHNQIGHRWDDAPIDEPMIAGTFIDAIMCSMAVRINELGEMASAAVDLIRNPESPEDFHRWKVSGIPNENKHMPMFIEIPGNWMLTACTRYSMFGDRCDRPEGTSPFPRGTTH